VCPINKQLILDWEGKVIFLGAMSFSRTSFSQNCKNEVFFKVFSQMYNTLNIRGKARLANTFLKISDTFGKYSFGKDVFGKNTLRQLLPRVKNLNSEPKLRGIPLFHRSHLLCTFQCLCADKQ